MGSRAQVLLEVDGRNLALARRPPLPVQQKEERGEWEWTQLRLEVVTVGSYILSHGFITDLLTSREDRHLGGWSRVRVWEC